MLKGARKHPQTSATAQLSWPNLQPRAQRRWPCAPNVRQLYAPSVKAALHPGLWLRQAKLRRC